MDCPQVFFAFLWGGVGLWAAKLLSHSLWFAILFPPDAPSIIGDSRGTLIFSFCAFWSFDQPSPI